MKDDAGAPIEAVRSGPGRYVLAAQSVFSGLKFTAEGQTFRVVSQPVALGGDRYLANIAQTEGPSAGRLITAELRLSPRAGLRTHR